MASPSQSGKLDSDDYLSSIDTTSIHTAAIIYVRIGNFLLERMNRTEVLDILYWLWTESTNVRIINRSLFVFPSLVLSKILEKLMEESPQKIHSSFIRKLFRQVLKEESWVYAASLNSSVVNSIVWASLLNGRNDSISRIALRNFFEIAFVIPISLDFVVDPNSFTVQRLSTIDKISSMGLKREFQGNQPISQFVYQLAEGIIASAKKMKLDPLGEERFLLRELPDFASTFIHECVKDFKAQNPRLFTKNAWKHISKIPCPLTQEPLSEFMNHHACMNRYDRKTFDNKIRELMADALYYSDDCFDMIEGRSKEAYHKLEDLTDILFDKSIFHW